MEAEWRAGLRAVSRWPSECLSCSHLVAREAVHPQQAEGDDPCPVLSPGETHLEICDQCWAPQSKRQTHWSEVILGSCFFFK